MNLKIDKDAVVEKVKFVSDLAIHSGTGALACGLIRLVVPPGVGVASKGAMLLGGIVLGQFLGAKTSEYMCDEIDETIELIESTRTEIKKRVDVLQDKDLINGETTA